MLTRMDVITNQGSSWSLPLGDTDSGFFITDISGLDPVKATLVSSSYANQDGEQYQTSRREKRNIVIKMDLASGARTGSTATMRKTLYQFFMPKSVVRLRFSSEELDPVDIFGRVEFLDSPLFAKEPTATISIICYNPDFFYINPDLYNGNTTSTTDEALLNYEGTVETGFKFKLLVDRNMDAFTIYHRDGNGVASSLEFIAPLVAGDVLTISTVTGAKGATLTRNGSDEPILYGVSPYANWINLSPGPNYIRVASEGADVPYTLEYTTKFGGL